MRSPSSFVPSFRTRVQCYLLEKPRICKHMKGERNYHVFYMAAKAPPDIHRPSGPEYQMRKWQSYAMLNQAGTIQEVETWNDAAEFKDMHAAFAKLGFADEERQDVYRILATVMEIGNIQFVPNDETSGSSFKDEAVVAAAAKMLKCDPKDLGFAVTSKTVGGGAIEVFQKPLEPQQANAARNSLVMFTYAHLPAFDSRNLPHARPMCCL